MGNNREDLCAYRLSEADRCIQSAEAEFVREDYKSATNRSYYAMFHCIRALLAMERIDYKHHSAVIGHFRRQYVKSGLFDIKYSDYIGRAFDIRGKSDYDDFYIVSKQEVREQVDNARELYSATVAYVENLRDKD